MSTASARNLSSAVLLAGIAVMVAAVVWWFVYYGQWEGAFRLLDVKLTCITADSFECSNFRDFIGTSAVPVYSPVLMWVGVIVTLIGLYLVRRNRAERNG